MSEVDFVPPVRPRTLYTTSPGPVIEVGQPPSSPINQAAVVATRKSLSGPDDDATIKNWTSTETEDVADPTEISEVTVDSSTSTEIEETAAVDSQNETVNKEAPATGSEGYSSKSGGQNGDVQCVALVEKFSRDETDSLVSDNGNGRDVASFTSSAQSSKVGSERERDKNSPDQIQGDTTSSENTTFNSSTFFDGTLSHTEVTTQSAFQSEDERANRATSSSPEPIRNSSVPVLETFKDKTGDNVSGISFNGSLENPVGIKKVNLDVQSYDNTATNPEIIEERNVDDFSYVNSIERARSCPVTSHETESTAFRISEKEVKQKKDELSSANPQSFDTAWQFSVGDGGRFRMRSVAKKDLSYSEVFGENATVTTTAAKTAKESRGKFDTTNSSESTGITAEAKTIDGMVTKIRDSEGLEQVKQKMESTEISKTDGTMNSQHQPADHHQTAAETGRSFLKLEPKSKKNEPISDKPCTEVIKYQTVESRPPLIGIDDIVRDVPTPQENVSSPEEPEIGRGLAIILDNDDTLLVGNRVMDKSADSSEITSLKDSKKSYPIFTDSSQADRTQEFVGLRVVNRENNTTGRRQPETIVIDKSKLSFAGSLNRRSTGTSRSAGEEKLTTRELAKSADRSSKLSASLAGSADGNRLQQQRRSGQRSVFTEEFPKTESAIAARVEQPVVATHIKPRNNNAKSTVVRVVNGFIVHESASPVASPAVASKHPPTVPPKSVGTSNNNISLTTLVYHDDQLSLDDVAVSAQPESAGGDSYSGKTSAEGLAMSTNDESASVNTATKLVDVDQPFTKSFNELNTTTTTEFVDTIIPPPSSYADDENEAENTPVAEKAEIIAIPEWRRVTAAKSLSETHHPSLAVNSGVSTVPKVSVESRTKTGVIGRNAVDGTKNTAYGAPVRPLAKVGSTPSINLSFANSNHAATSKQSNSSYRTLPIGKADKVSATSSTTEEEELSSILAQARSLLRPTYRPVTYEVPTCVNGDGDSATSKFVLRSASSTLRRDADVVVKNSDVGENLVERKPPAPAGVVSSSAKTSGISDGRTFRSHAGAAVSALSLPPAASADAKYSSSTTSVRNNNSPRQFGSSTSDEVGSSPKQRSKSATLSTFADSRGTAEAGKPETEEIKSQSPSPRPGSRPSPEAAVKRSPPAPTGNYKISK